MPGPVPSREADLARPRERKGSDIVPVTRGVLRNVRVPHPDPDWHPIATMIYKNQKSSGQADLMQNSDWAMLYSLCDDMSYFKNQGGRRSAQLAQVIYSGLERLLVTEGDRRRVRLELHEKETESQSAELYAIDTYKGELGLTAD